MAIGPSEPDERPVKARRAAVKLIDSRCTPEIVPRDLFLPCRDQLLVLVVARAGGLGLVR